MNASEGTTMHLAAEITDAHLATLVHRFYDKVRLDPDIGPVFHAAIADWDTHLDIMVRFWSTIMLASRTYKGNPLAVHLDIPITPSMFDRWLALWNETTEELFVPTCAGLLQQKAQKMGQNMRFALFGHSRDSTSTTINESRLSCGDDLTVGRLENRCGKQKNFENLKIDR